MLGATQPKRKKRTNKVLAKQIHNGLKSVTDTSNIMIAYEPVWSIGTGLIPKPNDSSVYLVQLI